MTKSLSLVLLSLLLTGCSLEKHLAALTGKLDNQYASMQSWEQLPVRTITWNQALAMMREKNLELLEAQQRIEKAERESLSVYTDMIPGVSYYGYFTSSINELTNVSSTDNFSNNVNVTFGVPALTQIPYRVYSAKATTFSAIKALEGKERELASKLYSAVRIREIDRKLAGLDDQTPEDRQLQQEMRKARQDDADVEYWTKVADILGSREARWEILRSSVPSVRWEDYAPKLKRLDPLVVCNYALRLEQSRMSMYGIALRYLPTINTSIYSPSLFSSTGGTYSGTFLSGEDTRLNLSVSYSLDTQLSSWYNYKNTRDTYERTKIKVYNEMMDHKLKLGKLSKSVDEYFSWRNYMLKRMDFVKSQSCVSATEYLEVSKKLKEMERELLTQERTAVESEAAIVLEYGFVGKKR